MNNRQYQIKQLEEIANSKTMELKTSIEQLSKQTEKFEIDFEELVLKKTEKEKKEAV